MKKIIISFIVAVGVIVLAMAVLPTFFKGKINQLVKDEANKAVNARVDFEDISISLFKSFPNVYVGVDHLTIVGLDRFENDTLLDVKSVSAVLNVMDFLSGEYRIRRINIENPVVLLKVASDGSANWDIQLPSEDLPEEDSGEGEGYTLELTKVTLSNGILNYFDEELDTYLTLEGLHHVLSGDLTADNTKLKTQTSVNAVFLEYGKVQYLNNATMDLTADFDADLKNGIYHLEKNSLKINDVVLEFNGSVGEEMNDRWNIMLTFNAPRNSFKSFLSLVPAIYAKDFGSLEASGDFAMNGFVKGIYGEEEIPSFEVSIRAENGKFKYPDLPSSVNDIFVAGKVSNPGSSMNEIEVDLSRISFNALENEFDARLYMNNFMTDPYLELEADIKTDLADIEKVYPLESGEEIRGIVEGNLMLSGFMSAIEEERYDEFKAMGSVRASNMLYKSSYLPDPLDISTLQINLAPSYIDLVGFRATSGSNDLNLKGKIEDYLAYFLKDGEIKGNLLFKSDTLNLNSIMQSDGQPMDETPDTTELTAYEIPRGIHFILNSDIGYLKYGDIEMQNLKGILEIVDQKLLIKDLRSSVLDGNLVLNGKYDTWDPASPLIDFSLQIKDISIPGAGEAFFLLGQYAPFARRLNGAMNIDLNFRSLLNNNMLPVLTTLTGKGKVNSRDIAVEGINTLSMLSENLSVDQVKEFNTGPVDLSFQFNDGIVNVKPFTFKAGDIQLDLSGWTSFDREIGYELKMDIPRSLLGTTLNDNISGLMAKAGPVGDELMKAESLPLTALIGGSLENPTINLNISDAAEDIINELKQKALEELDKKKEEVVKQAKQEADKIIADGERMAQTVLDEAQKRADQVMSAARALAEETRNEADKQASKIEEEGKKKGVIAAAAARTAAGEVRKEGDKQGEKIISEAQKNADNILEKARQEAQKIRNEAKERADRL